MENGMLPLSTYKVSLEGKLQMAKHNINIISIWESEPLKAVFLMAQESLQIQEKEILQGYPFFLDAFTFLGKKSKS